MATRNPTVGKDQVEKPYLLVNDGKGERRVSLDDGTFTIGRNFTNLLVLDETMASRFHCVIENTPDGLLLRDLESRNGTLVNGQAVQAAIISNGDMIQIGKTEISLVVPEAKSAPPKMVIDRAVAELAELTAEPKEEEEDSDGEGVAAPASVLTSADYEAKLRERAEALTDRSFGEKDIVLINARGKVAHAAGAVKESGEAVTLLRLIMLICFRSRATDMHIEPKSEEVNVRVRVDGILIDVVRITKELGIRLSSVVKVLSDIDIAQRIIVQEGHFSAKVPSKSKDGVSERRIDYRVSFAPAMHGQKLVIRVLDEANAPLHIDDLNLPPKAMKIIQRTSEQDSGMILVCGPTGSGKTTTLYSILRDIDVTERNVVTIEDPVEIQLDGVTQIPVNEAQGNTFSNLLRSVLRQDPDVILVGEIRDTETARVAVQAAMTGHLVFSTVHSRDALSGMFRLLDLGVEPYVVASGLHVVLVQRLVRQLCPHCKIAKAPNAEQAKRLAQFGFTKVPRIYEPKGCKRCLGTGHFGRRAVFEILNTTPALREVIVRSPQQQECLKVLNNENYITLAENGYRLIAEGVASWDETERTIA